MKALQSSDFGDRQSLGYTRPMSDSLHLTILYEEGDDGWVLASIPEVPGVFSQGKTKDEAREMALDALAGMLELRAEEHRPQGKSVGSESLNIVAA